MHTETRTPHALRLAIFFLRLAVGLNFFYFGWSALFNRNLAMELSSRSLGWLSHWLNSPAPLASIPANVFAWIFLAAGLMIVAGLFTRLASFVAIVVIVASLLSAIDIANFSLTQLVNDEVVTLFALLVIIFGKAGTYFGLDKFLRWRKRKE